MFDNEKGHYVVLPVERTGVTHGSREGAISSAQALSIRDAKHYEVYKRIAMVRPVAETVIE